MTWLVPDRVTKGKSQKDRKISRVEKKQFFSKRKSTHLRFCFFQSVFLFFLKKQVFVLKKNTKAQLCIVYIASCNITIFKITQ